MYEDGDASQLTDQIREVVSNYSNTSAIPANGKRLSRIEQANQIINYKLSYKDFEKVVLDF
jgi:hypothetical protein